jgi:hypothetical protein
VVINSLHAQGKAIVRLYSVFIKWTFAVHQEDTP